MTDPYAAQQYARDAAKDAELAQAKTLLAKLYWNELSSDRSEHLFSDVEQFLGGIDSVELLATGQVRPR